METPELIQGEKSFHRNEGGCRHLLVPVTCDIPASSSFHRMFFSTCSTHSFSFLGQKCFFTAAHARMRTQTTPPINFTPPPHGTHVHANGVVQCLLTWRPTIYRGDVRLE